MGYRRQKLLIIKSGDGGGAVTEDAIALISGAALNTGVGQPTDTLDLVALNDTTLRIKAAQQMFFTENFAPGVPIAEAMVSFPQIDYPLASLGLAADGTYLRYIGYDVDGNVVVGTSNFYMSPNVAHLGFVLVKRVGGVTTFLDGAAGLRNVSSSPMLAGSSLLERAYATTQSNVSVLPLSGGLTFAKQAGVIRAPSINWHGGANIHELPVAAQSPAAFTRINPASASSPALPAFGTAFNATTYWNGVASVAVPNPQNATVQRWLVGFKGGLWLQEGERFYNNLSDAADALWNAPFTNIYPADTYAEVARTAATKNVSDVGNNAQSVTVQTGHVGGSGSGAAGSGPVFAESLLGVTIAPNVVNASLNHLTPIGGILNLDGGLKITTSEQNAIDIVSSSSEGTIKLVNNTGILSLLVSSQTYNGFALGTGSNHNVSFVRNNVYAGQFTTIGFTLVGQLDVAGTVNSTSPGTNIFFGDIRLQNGGNEPRKLHLYNGTGSNEGLIVDVGGTSQSVIQIQPAGIPVFSAATTQVTIDADFRSTKGRMVGFSAQTGTSLALDATFHYVTAGNAGATVYNLPPVATNAGREYWIKNVGGLAVTIVPNGAETIYTTAQVANVVLNPGQWLHVVSTGVYWIETGTNSSTSSLLILPPSTTISASMRMPHGVAPSAPVNGDMWTTATGAFVQIGGTTVQFGSTTTGTTDAGTLTGATLASNVINASINHITPAGGNLTITGTGLMTGNFLMQGNTANFGAAGNPSLFNLNLHGNTGGTLTFQINGGAITSRIEGTAASLLLDGPQVVIDVAGNLRAFFHGTGLQVQGTVSATGVVTGSNLSGTNTGDQNLSGYAPLAGAAFTGPVTIASTLSTTGMITVNGPVNTGVTVNDGTRTGLFATSSAGGIVIGSTNNVPLFLASNGAVIGTISPTGLALTGSLVTTATITTNGSVALQTAVDSHGFILGTLAGVPRWQFNTTNVESGSNTGSHLILQQYNDAGAGMGITMSFNRTNGAISMPFGGGLTVSGGVVINGPGGLAAKASATNQQPALLAGAVDYATSFKGAILIYSGDTATGTTAGLSNSNLGWLNFQNCTNAVISTNGLTSILMAPQGIPSMRWNPASIDVLTYLNFGANSANINPPTYTTRSSGTRIVFYSNVNPSDTDFAMGVESNTLWTSTSVGGSIKFYGGTNLFGYWGPGILVSNGDFVVSGGYMNFGGIQGSTGYGFRNNGGTIEWKNSGGNWAAIGGGGGGGVTSVGIVGNNGITVISGSPITTNGNINLGLGDITPNSVNVATTYKVGGTQVVGTRQPAITTINLTNGNYNTEFNTINIAVNNIIFRLRIHGLIDP